jgi:NitT/TauT family transport system substrate-binding protein
MIDVFLTAGAKRKSRILGSVALCFGLLAGGLGPVRAADTLRIAAQASGTFSWELGVIKDHGLDKKAGIDLDVTELATTEAGKVAIMGGSADVVISDWLWVSRERSLGGKLKFYPYSSSLGAVMVPAGSPIKAVADLKGKKLGVAGGPLDKSWLLLQAYAKNSGTDLESDATVLYGAPPLLTQQALQGHVDATLNFWNFCAALEAKGFNRLVGLDAVETALGASGRVAMIGYVFDETYAAGHADLLHRFFAMTAQAQDILAHSPDDWKKIGEKIGVSDPAALDIYRKRYLDGLARRPVAAEEADARKLYLVLAKIGGAKLVGPASELDSGTFYTDTASP